jgi:GNAT superfamily N-acetyltransferase
VSSLPDITIVDVTDTATFGRLPPCADARFDHRSCDYWEDEVHGSKAARSSWWQPGRPAPRPKPRPAADNPFAPPSKDTDEFNPFLASETEATEFNPFAPRPQADTGSVEDHAPRKLRLLERGRAVFGSYAKVLLLHDEPAVYAQFGPLSAYPRAQRIRDLYPRLPSSPLPAVITCVAATEEARGQGLGRALIEDIVEDLAGRGFSAIEAYPDLDLDASEASAARPGFWERCGFVMVEEDERYPVMRRELE